MQGLLFHCPIQCDQPHNAHDTVTFMILNRFIYDTYHIRKQNTVKLLKISVHRKLIWRRKVVLYYMVLLRPKNSIHQRFHFSPPLVWIIFVCFAVHVAVTQCFWKHRKWVLIIWKYGNKLLQKMSLPPRSYLYSLMSCFVFISQCIYDVAILWRWFALPDLR